MLAAVLVQWWCTENGDRFRDGDLRDSVHWVAIELDISTERGEYVGNHLIERADISSFFPAAKIVNRGSACAARG